MISTSDAPNYEVEVSEHLNSVHFEGDGPVNEYSFHDQQHQDPVADYVQEAPAEEFPSSHNVVNYQQESLPAADEPVAEPQKFSYASIVCISTIVLLSCFCCHILHNELIMDLSSGHYI